ncbi:phosphorylcholine transferase LicD [uncultured Methanobrevibacter sp.]|uniref:LicD family protein n=1 Tax=uncultured Methanobrevibacter sp. TaxID=253161 RepID=UPI002611EB19|nr:LicD family protein [uncultured Methanobrevibacter sp.]
MFKSKRYDDETLKHLQKVQLMMLKDFIKICEKNNITYFAIGGTLLGAIRHQGFIPWDDDIDVIMFREDFEKLNSIMSNNPNDKYHLINVLNEETYHYTWGRFNLKNTILNEWWAKQVDYTVNIFLDIFIMDNIPNNKLKRFIHRWSSFTLNQMVQYSLVKFKNESKIKEIIQQSAYYFLKLIPISPMTIKKRCIKTYRKYENINCNEVCDFPSLMHMPIYNKKDFLPLKKCKFENIEINVPNNYDKILTRLYGNYMELPPKNKRFRPAPEKLDFGKY